MGRDILAGVVSAQAFERLAPGAISPELLHCFELPFHRGEARSCPLLRIECLQPVAHKSRASSRIAAAGASAKTNRVAAEAPKANSVGAKAQFCLEQILVVGSFHLAPSNQPRHRPSLHTSPLRGGPASLLRRWGGEKPSPHPARLKKRAPLPVKGRDGVRCERHSRHAFSLPRRGLRVRSLINGPRPSRRAFGPPQDEGEWRAEKRANLWHPHLAMRLAPSGAPRAGVFGIGPRFSPVRHARPRAP
jgi:hypothetical protein